MTNFPTAQQEFTYLSGDGILITNTRAVLGNKTYAMSNITSVSIYKNPGHRVLGIIMAIISIISVIAFGLFTALITGNASGAIVGSAGCLVWAGLPMLIGIMLAIFSGPKYIVSIGTAGAEVNALESPNLLHIQQIGNALNEAIVRRG